MGLAATNVFAQQGFQILRDSLQHGPRISQERPRIPYEATARMLDGKIVSLADHKGKLVFLVIWRTDCPACIFEIPVLNKIQEEYAGDDFTIIGLSMDRGKDDFVKKVAEMRQIDYPIWLGYGEPISPYTQTPVLPTLLVLGPTGEVIGYMHGAFPSDEYAVAVIEESRKWLEGKKDSK
jgi:thiol-disulfide isomerase/thioredoxin